jgi:hypothetical protein
VLAFKNRRLGCKNRPISKRCNGRRLLSRALMMATLKKQVDELQQDVRIIKKRISETDWFDLDYRANDLYDDIEALKREYTKELTDDV